MFVAMIIAAIANIACALVDDFWAYLVFRTLTGVGEMAMVLIPFTISIEIVGARKQNFVGNMNQLTFAIGEIVVSG